MIKSEREALKTLLDGIESCLELALKMIRNYRNSAAIADSATASDKEGI